MANEAPHPYGSIKEFEIKVNDAKHHEDSPIKTWISLNLWPEHEEAPLLMIGLWFPDTKDKAKADEYHAKAKEVETLLDSYLRTVSFQTLAR